MSTLPDRMLALIGEHDTMVLATADRDGSPEAAGVFFALDLSTERPALVCSLLATSTKLAHLRQNPRAAFYIGPRAPTRWLQGAGVARLVEAPDEQAARTAQLIAGAPGAGVFIERVPVTAVVIEIRTLKLTDLTGVTPPVVVWPVTG